MTDCHLTGMEDMKRSRGLTTLIGLGLFDRQNRLCDTDRGQTEQGSRELLGGIFLMLILLLRRVLEGLKAKVEAVGTDVSAATKSSAGPSSPETAGKACEGACDDEGQKPHWGVPKCQH